MNGTKTHQSHTSLNSVRLRTACALIAAGLLSRCNPFETSPYCDDYFTENASRVSRYNELGRGLVLHNPTNTTWLKCPAGMSLSSAGDCRGEPLYLSFDEAAAYAAEASEKSGQNIRLPSVSEMRALNEDACINPGSMFVLSPRPLSKITGLRRRVAPADCLPAQSIPIKVTRLVASRNPRLTLLCW